MNRSPYSSYRGRTPLGRRILIAIVVLLVLALCALVAWRFWLSNYVVYDENGPHLVLGGPLATPAPSPDAQEPEIVIDVPSAQPDPTPAPEEVDLSAFPRRELPLGLVSPGAWGEEPPAGRGAVYDMTDPGGLYAVTADANAQLLYSAAYLAPDWSTAGEETFAEDLSVQCVALAARGFDEIILSAADPAKAKADGLAETYAAIHSALAKGGWQGRLGLVLDQGWFRSDSGELISGVATQFDRLYFQNALSASGKKALEDGGFASTGYSLVTLYAAPPKNVNWSWAVLPQRT